VTIYNNRIYRIKAVHFDKTPEDTFIYHDRAEKKSVSLTFAKYYSLYYPKDIQHSAQPMLEAYAVKESEQVFLVPELCALTGFNDEMRKDKNLIAEALKQTKVSPQERLTSINNLTEKMAGEKEGPEWNFTLDTKPLEVQARIFEPLEVVFVEKRYCIEEGNFQRWMRHGLQCPTNLTDWLFIYPENDVPVLDIWLRSLRDIAQVAFTMKMSDPTRIICSDQRNEIESVLENRVTPKTQMILLLTPHRDSKRVYNLFKKATCTKFPCVTQVVKSETIRRRQSIAAILSRIVLQINAKFCGPLWHIDLNTQQTKPVFARPVMVIGIDVYLSLEGEQYMGFAASLDTMCTEYFSIACAIDANAGQNISVKLQSAMRDAILQFTHRNDGVLPEHFIVYRASVFHGEWPLIKAVEVESILKVIRAVGEGAVVGAPYAPKLTFVTIAKRVGMRFFAPSPNQHNIKNPEPGTVVDCQANRSDMYDFYLINQAVLKGTASPTYYAVLHDDAKVEPNVLQNLTYRLSFLYYNFTGSVKMPAPAQYAKKIAHLVGTAVKAEPNKRLLCTFFYL